MTVTTNTPIAAADYNTVHYLIEDILGLNENGWGLPLLSSNPATAVTTVVNAREYNRLLDDINVAHSHITNANTSISYVVTGTTIVAAGFTNSLTDVASWLNNNSRRYTSHPDQYFRVNLVGGGTSSNILPNGGTSTRTLVWGANDITQITHRVTCAFRNRLAARYYFNQGNYLTWIPYYNTSTGLINDLDGEWSNFINYLVNSNQYKYRRDEYLIGDTSTYYTSGTLYVNVIANRSNDQSRVDFTIEYGNSASPNLLISPAVGTYNIVL